MEESNKKNIFKRFKESYGISGMFLFVVIVIASYIKIDNFWGLKNMYSVMTSDEIRKVLFSVITLEMVSSFILALLGIVTIYFFIKLKDKALICAFVFIALQPILDGLTEIGYSGNIGSGVGSLIGGAIIFWIFWHFLGQKASSYLKLAYVKKINL
ncbi:MAG: hypothetical protein WCS89_01075 [Candidatus Paceibacterota bacterium]|jgi:hypothetical protein